MPICRKTCKQTLSNAQPSAESVIWNHQIMTDRKAVIKNADMSEDMQTDAVECATQALEKYNIEKDIAAFIKKEFDKKIQPNLALHCWPQLWQLRYPRDQALYLFLFGTGCYSLVQIWISEFLPKLSARQQRSHLIHHLVVIPLKVNQLSLCNINKYY